ncbi:hypothetical protein KY285_000631 [Solanum tuberosum]|nr:hypothetical protein KY285_000631 [Solanum tuberosum]
MKRRHSKLKIQPPNMGKIMVQKAEVEEKEDFAVVEVMVMEGEEEGMMDTDSGGSNHMTGVKFLFRELDEKQKQKVHLGNTKELLVEGKAMVSIDTNKDKNKQWLSYLGSMCEQAPNGAR